MRCEGVEAITVQRLYNRYLKYGSVDKTTTLVIDEIPRVNASIWHSLMPFAKLGVHIICMGNPEDQLLSAQDSWMDVSLAIDVPEGTLLKSICGYKRLRLVEGNGSCKQLFDVYASCSTIVFRFGR